MAKITATLVIAAVLAAGSMPAKAAVVGVPTGQTARVMGNIANTQRRNNAAITHVRSSIAATRRRQF